jgi:uncharacterized protein YcfJ
MTEEIRAPQGPANTAPRGELPEASRSTLEPEPFMITITGLFGDQSSADHAIIDLRDVGFVAGEVTMVTAGESPPDQPVPDGITPGTMVMSVHVPEGSRASQARSILERHGARVTTHRTESNALAPVETVSPLGETAGVDDRVGEEVDSTIPSSGALGLTSAAAGAVAGGLAGGPITAVIGGLLGAAAGTAAGEQIQRKQREEDAKSQQGSDDQTEGGQDTVHPSDTR